MPEYLPYGRHSIDDTDIRAVVEALSSDFLTTGPRVAAFERAIADRMGPRFAAALSSGTAALHAAYGAVGVGVGDEVIMPPLTFAATANAAVYLGARPVFVDVDPHTGVLDPGLVEDAITPRTKAIAAVDYAGQPADYDALRRIADRHGLPVVADAAHSLGATDDGRPVGSLADMTVLSFHPVKHITTLEGGAVLTDDARIHERVIAFRSHGIVRDAGRVRTDEGPWHQEMQSLGYNYRLSDVACALGTSQLRRLDGFLERRRAIAARYNDAFGGDARLHIPQVRARVQPAWHLYVLRVAGDAGARRPFFEALRSAGLGVQVHYLPVYRHPYYADLGYRPGLCPVAEEFYARAVSIPIFPAMEDRDVDRVIADVRLAADAVLRAP